MVLRSTTTEQFPCEKKSSFVEKMEKEEESLKKNQDFYHLFLQAQKDEDLQKIERWLLR